MRPNAKVGALPLAAALFAAALPLCASIPREWDSSRQGATPQKLISDRGAEITSPSTLGVFAPSRERTSRPVSESLAHFRTLELTNFSLCPFRHRTRYYDRETWLYYYGHRYYDPSTTKWISKDPKGEAGGWNLTAFCGCDPINNWDALGDTNEPGDFGWKWYDSFLPSLADALRSFIPDQTRYFDAAPSPYTPKRDISGGLAEKLKYIPLPPDGNDPVAMMQYYAGIGEYGKAALIQKDLGDELTLDLASVWLLGLQGRLLWSSFGKTITTKGVDDFVVSFMGKNAEKYYSINSPTLGAKGGIVWVSPIEDVADIANRAGIVTRTGHAPGPLASYLKGDSIYGIAIPRESLKLRSPNAMDAGVNRHFKLGGLTGVEHNGVWRSSDVREFILDGGVPVPDGSIFFEFNSDEPWRIIRRF